jgi:2-C-methyl-D-erythritol 4-phosphate cytidylyltransferase
MLTFNAIMKKYLIIAAGGSGQRMASGMPKQFLPLAGKPLLMHTLEAFHAWDTEIRIVLVLSAEGRSIWQRLCTEQRFDIKHETTGGGITRFHSVKNGLERVPDGVLVAIHDAVRPFVSQQSLESVFRLAKEKGAAIPVVDIPESLREISQKGNKTVDREKYRLVQTPQVFQSTLIKQAFNQKYRDEFTDEASVAEAAGHRIHLSVGSRENIKITHPADLLLAEYYYNQWKSKL